MSTRRRPSHRSIEEELLVGFESHVTGTWRPVLVEQVRMLQAARTPQEFTNLHNNLLETFVARQDVAAGRRDEAERLKAQQKRLVGERPIPKDALRRLQEDADRLGELDFRDAVLQHVARCVANGPVWRLLAADRRA